MLFVEAAKNKARNAAAQARGSIRRRTVRATEKSMQMITAEMVTRAGDVPPAVASALHALLEGNVKKVLISIGLWLPYLLLSRRVNVTYRQRIPA